MSNVTKDNRVLLGKLTVIALLMFGFAYGLVPFYKKICEVTGINNLIKADVVTPANTQVDKTRVVSIEFDANLRGDLPWQFHPGKSRIEVHPGELTQVVYDFENRGSKAIVGQAVPSYAPAVASRYFNKLECFCFRQQTFAPGEKRRMPVIFVIDPALPQSVTTITLSYSFFEVAGTAKGSS